MMSQKTIMDLEDRDPNALSQNLHVVWEDIIGEPESFRSPECAWRVSHHCFRLSKNCCYICLSVIIAPLTALCLGCSFACLAFKYIWCWTPCIRTWKLTCSAIRTMVRAAVEAVIVPICEGLGYFWANVRVRHQNLPDGPDHHDDVLVI